MTMNIDVSTHQLAEQTWKALGGKSTLEDILTIWHSVGKLLRLSCFLSSFTMCRLDTFSFLHVFAGNVISDQLTHKKGVKMSSFGTFTLTEKGEPVFLISSDLTTQFKLKQRPQPASANISTSNLNFSQVREGTNIPRDLVEKIYLKFLTCMGRAIFEARNILITIHKVADIAISNGELVCRFAPQFLDQFVGGKDPIKTGTQRAVQRGETKRDQVRSNQFHAATGNRTGMDQFGGEIADPRRSKMSARAGSNPRGATGYNPITGASDPVRRPASAGRPGRREDNVEARRPSSAQTMSTSSTLLSPRAAYRGGAAPARPSARGDGGLRKEQLDRFNKSQNNGRGVTPAADARKLAARALDVGDIVEKVRRKIVERGGSNGIRSISKLLSIMDDNGDKRLSKEELRYGLRDYGVDLTPTEMEQVFLFFDRDGNGFIDCTEFLVGLRGDLSQRRKKFVRLAFDVLDSDQSGRNFVSLNPRTSNFDPHFFP